MNMKHFTKAACVLDTCSIINLDNVVLAQRDILYYVRCFFDVRVCQTIREELQRHMDRESNQEISYWNSFLSKQTYLPTILTDDRNIIGPFYSNPPATFDDRNRGERGNARVALELLLTRTIGHAIFVTDDKNASNAFLESMRQSFPGIHLWTSVDVILYVGAVLLKERRAEFDHVKEALRAVYAVGAVNGSGRNEIDKDSIIKKHSKNVDRLKLINRVVAHWRR